MKLVYLVNLVGGLSNLCIIALVGCGIFCVYHILRLMNTYELHDDTDPENVGARKGIKKWFYIFLVVFAIQCAIPSKQTMYEILGIGMVIDYVQNNDNAKALPDKALEAVNLWLDNIIENQKK